MVCAKMNRRGLLSALCAPLAFPLVKLIPRHESEYAEVAPRAGRVD